jgi:sterol-4alpha-carboxylate 3-dehydrogenase (decarboxylating)
MSDDGVQSDACRAAVRDQLKRLRITVIGGRGRLGRALVAAAYEASGVRVTVVDVAPVSDADRQSVRATHVVGDVRDVDALERCCAGADLVFLTSALIDLNPWTPHAARVHDVNVGGAQRTVDAARRCGVRAVVFTSSIDVQMTGAGHGDVLDGDESWPAFSVAPERHLNQYSLTKALAEQLVLAADDPRALRTAALRPGHIYAPGDPMIEFAVNLTRTPLLRHFWLVTRGTVHDVIYVENLAVAHILLARTLLARETSATVAGQAFIVSDDAVNLNDQIAAFFPHGAPRPRFFVPRVVVSWIACLVELALYLCSLVGVAPRDATQLFTRFAAFAVTHTLHFRTDKARRAFGNWTAASRADALAIVREIFHKK